MLKWWKRFWQPRLTADELQACIKSLSESNRKDLFDAIQQLVVTTPDTVDFNRRDLYIASALTGLLARAGTLGGPVNNSALIREGN